MRLRQEKVLMKEEKVLVTRAEQSRSDELQVQEKGTANIVTGTEVVQCQMWLWFHHQV